MSRGTAAGPSMDRRAFAAAAGAAAAAGLIARRASAEAAAVAPAAGDGTFRFALNSATIRGQKLSLPDQMRAAAAAGYDGIEPWTSDIKAHLDGGGTAKDLGQLARDLGLKVVSAIGFANWIVDDDAKRAAGLEQMRREMDWLAAMGGTHIAAPPAGAYGPPRIDLDRVAERYRAVLEIGRASGVIPQVEFWGGSANLGSLADAAYVAAKAGHPDACILADAYHLYKSGEDPAALGVIGRRALHCFHLNDYPAGKPRETIKDADRVWPGDGVAPLKEILSTLAANRAEVYLSLEVFNADYWKLPAAEAAKTGLEKMRAILAKRGE